MSKPLAKQTAQKPAVRVPKPKEPSEVQALQNEPLLEQDSRQKLPEHRTSQRLRQASILRMQRRQGNGYVQRALRRRGLANEPYPGKPGSLPPAPLVQRQVEDEQASNVEQPAVAHTASQAAEGSASQTASQAQQASGSSQAAASQEQQSSQQEQHSYPGASSQAVGPAGTQGEQGPVGQSGADFGRPETSSQVGQAASGEHAPTSPQEDEGFLSIIEQIRQKAEQHKSHPQSEQKAQEAQDAAVSPAAETESRAKTGHVQELQAAETPAVDQGGLKAQLMQKIQALTPTTAGEADQLQSSNKLGGLKAELKGKMAEEKNKATDPMKKKSEAGPSQAGIAPKPVKPLPPPKPPSPISQFNAEPAVPKPKPKSEIEKPLTKKSKSLDEQMAEADITEEQLEKSNEPEFKSALDAKKEAQDNAEEGPAAYRQGEQEQITEAKNDANSSANSELQGMQDIQQHALDQVATKQGKTKSDDEAKRQEVAKTINGIYDKTKINVERILGNLDAKVNPLFESGAAAAQAAFEAFVTARMEAYKQSRYGGMLGWARWAKDKLLGMPAEVNQFYSQGRQRYLAQMDAVIDNVVAIIANAIAEAKSAVAQGRAEIQSYVDQLPADLQQVGQEAAADIQDRFDQLESQIDQRQQEVADQLAQRYAQNLQAIDARVAELQAQNDGLLQAATNAIRGVVQTIAGLTQRLSSILSRVATAVKDIMRDPVGFLGNLLGAVKSGFQQFLGNIATHLKRGLMGWLFKALGDAGIQLPESFDLKGVFSVVMQVLGITWENIRAKAVRLFGERAVGVLENVFDVFQVIKSEGLGGIFRFVRDQVTGITDLIMDALRQSVIGEVVQSGIQWLLGMLGGPAGAFVNAVEGIHGLIMWFLNNGRQLGSLAGAIMDSVTAVVGGAIGQATEFIERALARSIPATISFLANLLGLGNLGEKIRQVIERVRAPVNRLLDWIINKARSVVSGLGGMLGRDEGPAAAPGSPEAE